MQKNKEEKIVRKDHKMESMYCDREQAHNAEVQRAKEGILSGDDIAKVCKIFQLLSEPSRFKIVYALLKGEMCVYHITEVCGSTVSGISHQLRVLRDNGIVRAKRYGKYVEYSLADEHVHEMVEMGIKHLYCEK